MLQRKIQEARNTDNMEKGKNVKSQNSDNVGQDKVLDKGKMTDVKNSYFFFYHD